MRYLTAGFSHGNSYTAVLEGFPAGMEVDEGFINAELLKRQSGYGRSERMDIEHDTIRILSGVIDGVTTGAPIALSVRNLMHDRVSFNIPRPGHADYAGALKYNLTHDLSIVAERSSGRETVMATAIGAICKQLLLRLGITITSKVLLVGGISDQAAICELIDKLKSEGDTVGGTGEVVAHGIIAGLGSYVHRDRKLDGKIAGAIMSIPSVKAVEIGLGTAFSITSGSRCADVFTSKGRLSNNAGGIEGGMTNGQDIIVRLTVKPVPSLNRELSSMNMQTGKAAVTKVLRSDVCVVDSVTAVAEAVMAYELLSEILECLGGDTVNEVIKRYEQKRKHNGA